jgi:hypothetical protein
MLLVVHMTTFDVNTLHNCVGLWTVCSKCKKCHLTAGKMKHILNTEWKRNVNDNCSQLLRHINKPVRVLVVIMATDAHRFILLCIWPGSKVHLATAELWCDTSCARRHSLLCPYAERMTRMNNTFQYHFATNIKMATTLHWDSICWQKLQLCTEARK